MTFDFFEGPAGTGKTYNLVGLAAQLIRDGVIGEGRRLLALTFMNGARHRLETRLSGDAMFRRRFECQTFDVFARTLAARRRSLLFSSAAITGHAASLNEFDGPCFLAASLLENPCVRHWVASTFPLVLVDEAQDLDKHRLGILQGLSQASRVVVAADAFQCLTDGRDTTSLIDWLENAGHTHRLTQSWRTRQRGLLDAALAVREGRDIKTALTRSQRAKRPTWNAPGFRLVESFATNPGIVARCIADEMSFRTEPVAIISPDMSSGLIRDALNGVNSRVWQRNGQNFGPFPLTLEQGHTDQANALLAGVTLPDAAPYSDLRAVLGPLAQHAAIAQAVSRMDRLRRVKGQDDFSATQVKEFVYRGYSQPVATRLQATAWPSCNDDPSRQEQGISECHRALAAHCYRQLGSLARGCSITPSRAPRAIAA